MQPARSVLSIEASSVGQNEGVATPQCLIATRTGNEKCINCWETCTHGTAVEKGRRVHTDNDALCIEQDSLSPRRLMFDRTKNANRFGIAPDRHKSWKQAHLFRRS